MISGSKDHKIAKAVQFHDINFWTGENFLSKRLTISDSSLKKILKERKSKFNIVGTTVTHFISLFYYPKEGNDAVAKLVSTISKEVSGVNGALVMEQDYFAHPDNFGEGLRKRYKQGFRLLRLFPKSHKYPYDSRCFREFYEVLDYYKFPVMISLDEIDVTGNKNIEWEKILEIAETYKNLPIIIDGGNSKELMYNSYLMVLLRNSSNVYVDTHNLFAINQIEDLSQIAGSDRLIFDSYFPYCSTILPVERIRNSSLGEVEIENIANLNIRRIFKNIKIS